MGATHYTLRKSQYKSTLNTADISAKKYNTIVDTTTNQLNYYEETIWFKLTLTRSSHYVYQVYVYTPGCQTVRAERQRQTHAQAQRFSVDSTLRSSPS